MSRHGLQLPRNTCSPARRADSVPNAKKHHPGTGTALRVVRSVVRHPLTPYDASVRSSGSHTKIENSVHRVRRRAPAKRPPNERRDAIEGAPRCPTLLLEGLRPGRVLGAPLIAPEDDARNAHIWCSVLHQKFLPGGRIPFNGSLQGIQCHVQCHVHVDPLVFAHHTEAPGPLRKPGRWGTVVS